MTDLTLAQTLAGVSEGPRMRFLEFQAQHPVRRLVVAGTSLAYVACGRGTRVLVHLPGLRSDAHVEAHRFDAGGHGNSYLQPEATLQLVDRFVGAGDRT